MWLYNLADNKAPRTVTHSSNYLDSVAQFSEIIFFHQTKTIIHIESLFLKVGPPENDGEKYLL